MANVPLSMNQLEKATQDAVDDTAFVINQFMSLLNEVMLTTAEQSKLI